MGEEARGKKGKAKYKKEDKKGGKKDVEKKVEFKLCEEFEYETRIITNRIDNNFGVAEFVLTDFLKPNVRRIKLLSHLAPIKEFVDNETTNLDLNTTAKK